LRHFFTIILILLSFDIVNAQDLVFAIGEWPPYTTETEKGLATEIVIAACKAVGLEYKIIHIPWLRAENDVEKGDVMATFPYAKTKERLIKYLFSDPILKSTNSIIYNIENSRINLHKLLTIQSFKNYKVGMNTGSDALAIPLRAIGAEVETTETIDQSMKKLISGRIDFIIEDTNVIKDLLRRYPNAKIVEFETNIINLDREYRLMFTKKSTVSFELIKRLNRGIQILRATGEYQIIVAKY